MASNQPQDNQLVNWVFTLHYVGTEDLPRKGLISYQQHLVFVGRLQELTERGTIRYHCYGYEEAPTTGQLHLQGYIQLEKRMRLRHLKGLLQQNTLHLEGTYASAERNCEYCSKSARFVEQGAMRSQEKYQARRQEAATSAKELKAQLFRAIQDGTKTADDCIEEHPHLVDFIQRIRGFRRQRSNQAKVLYLWGMPGCGKTYSVEKVCKELNLSLYKKCPGNKWFNGYDNQDVVLFKEFTSCVTCSTLLSLCDGYPPKQECKGG